jgi:hypothetical protein
MQLLAIIKAGIVNLLNPNITTIAIACCSDRARKFTQSGSNRRLCIPHAKKRQTKTMMAVGVAMQSLSHLPMQIKFTGFCQANYYIPVIHVNSFN